MAHVVVRIGKSQIESVITRRSAEELGLKKGDTELRTKINGAIEKMESSGAWKEAFDKNLGPAGITAPTPPSVDKN